MAIVFARTVPRLDVGTGDIRRRFRNLCVCLQDLLFESHGGYPRDFVICFHEVRVPRAIENFLEVLSNHETWDNRVVDDGAKVKSSVPYSSSLEAPQTQ